MNVIDGVFVNDDKDILLEMNDCDIDEDSKNVLKIYDNYGKIVFSFDGLDPTNSFSWDLSPDKKVLFLINNHVNPINLKIINLNTLIQQNIEVNKNEIISSVSNDGMRILLKDKAQNEFSLINQNANTLWTIAEKDFKPCDFSSFRNDGLLIVFKNSQKFGLKHLYLLNAETGQVIKEKDFKNFVDGTKEYNITNSTVSPDGNLIAFCGIGNGTFKRAYWVCDWSGNIKWSEVSVGIGIYLAFSSDGTCLRIYQENGQIEKEYKIEKNS